MLHKIQGGGWEQVWKGMERWEVSCTLSKESPETCWSCVGQGAGTGLGGMLWL